MRMTEQFRKEYYETNTFGLIRPVDDAINRMDAPDWLVDGHTVKGPSFYPALRGLVNRENGKAMPF